MPRRERGIPDSELEPAVVLTLNLGLRLAAMAAVVEVLPAEPVTPMILSLGFKKRSLRSWSWAQRRR